MEHGDFAHRTTKNCRHLSRSQNPGYLPYTPPKFNMEPENDGFQKESPFPGTSFFRFHVNLPGCNGDDSY